MNTVLVGYVTKPTTDDALRACEKGAGDFCVTANLPCGDSSFGSLTGAKLVIPGGGSRIVAITTASPHGTPGEITEGQIVLGVRTDRLD